MPKRPVAPTRRAPTNRPALERRLPFNAPVRAWTMAEWALLPLRLFLGVTFVYGGLQKLANPNFFRSASPISIRAQLIASSHTSPVHAILSHLIQFATPIGIVISFSELAIGAGVLLGLWTRIAAIGGALLSLTLFLTVSFHASPYFTGADILFFFAWMPFIIAGGGSRLSLDAWTAKRASASEGVASPELVAIPFATVQTVCGNFDRGKCAARAGLPCDAAVCPVLLGERAPLATRVRIDGVDRRALVLGATVAAGVGAATLILGGAVAEAGRVIGGARAPKNTTHQLSTPTTQPGPSSTTTPGGPGTNGTLLGAAKVVPSGQSALFTIPSSGDPGIVINTNSTFYAYDAVCPHAGCSVGWAPQNSLLVCPCHGSEFNVMTGDVLNGPAPHGLTKLKVVEESDGNLYLQ